MVDIDLAKVKRNVSKMVGMGAPETDIDAYIASEGTSIDAVRDFKPPQAPELDPSTGMPAGMVFDPASGQVIDTKAQAEINRRKGGFLQETSDAAGQVLAGFPVLGEDMDEAAGAIGGDMMREKTRAKLGAFQEANPWTAGTARLTGGVLGTMAGARALQGGAAATGGFFGLQGAAAAGLKSAPSLAKFLATLPGRMTVGSAVGGAMGAAQGFGAGEGGFDNRMATAERDGIIGAGFGAGAPALFSGIGSLYRGGKTVVGAVGDYLAPMSKSGQERMAGQRIADAASDPAALNSALAAEPKPLVQGSEPTTFQQTGDMGLGSLERDMQTKFPAEFQTRRAEQNAARLDAIGGVQSSGAPEAVSASIRRRLKTLDDETAAHVDAAQRVAQAKNDAVGPSMRPEDAGEALRGELSNARQATVAKEQQLWKAVDPDGTLGLPPQDLRAATKQILEELPASAKPPSAEEAAIYGVVKSYKPVMSFREVSALRSRVSQAISEERGRNGKSPAWARLVQLRGGIESDLENAVNRKVSQEAEAVAAGTMSEQDTLLANFARQAEAWKAEKLERSSQISGQSVGAGDGNLGTVRPPAIRTASGGQGEAGGGLRDAPRDPGLPQDAGGGASPQRLTSEHILSLPPEDPFFVSSKDGRSFIPRADGNPNLGAAPDLSSGRDLPIRIRRKVFKSHLNDAPHRADAEILGYDDTWAMVDDIAANWTDMHRGANGRIMLVKPSPEEAQGVAVVELGTVDKDGYWDIVSTGRRKASQLGEKLAVRERTPEARSGTETPLVRGPTVAGQDKRFARAASEENYTPSGNGGQGFNPFDDAAKARLDAATAATKERAGTFDNRQLGPILARPADHSPFNMENASVAARVFTPGAGGFERFQTFRQAAGTPEALKAVEAYAVDRMRKAAMGADGLIDQVRLDAWKKSHAEVLRAFPELEARITDAGRASATAADIAVARKAALDAEQQGIFGKLIGVETPEEVTRIVGGLFGRQDSVSQLAALRQRVAGNPAALEGLRKAVADHITGRLIGNTEAATSGKALLKADQFQTFVKANRKALLTIFSEQEVGVLEAVASDLQRANRSLTAVKIPGQSNTAQDSRSILQGLVTAGADNWMAVAGGTGGAAVAGPVGAFAGGGAGALFNALRQNGIASAEALVRDAMLNPARARYLLTKVPVKPEQADRMYLELAGHYARAAAMAGATDRSSEDRRTRRPPLHAMDILPQQPSGSPLEQAVMQQQARQQQTAPSELQRALAGRGVR